jgi:hypothetical protein
MVEYVIAVASRVGFLVVAAAAAAAAAGVAGFVLNTGR